ncbi:glutamate--tRNA ligase [Ferrovibrio sp.]|uniref:glutamate--tRNA ligase n=1 Tax=Ferrovibrio sp. TaxID=1917215 RepID=UPI003D126DB9
MTVRTRVAPSPTGDPHVGTAYIALINYCFAKQHGGQFLLRIEDTDRVRSTLESERVILEALRWLGLSWDEGPDVGGPHGPYRQSERGAIYQQHCDHLLNEGHAFRCFCTTQTLDAMREEQRKRGEQPRYDGRCQHLSDADMRAKMVAGEPHVVRMKVPTEGVSVINDMRRGAIEIEWSKVDMQVLMKSDGMPTYHLANVVDDHLMGITHVMRGEEWISSAPKHQLLYKYFGWQMPEICHLPLLRNPDRSKLSKRKNPTGILFYQRMGYLPEALLNFLGLLTLSVAEGEEMRSLDQLVAEFAPDHISLGGPVFDTEKLNWLNSRYIRERLTPEQLIERVAAWAFQPERQLAIAKLAQSRITRLSDLGPLAGFMFAGVLDTPEAVLRDNKLNETQLRQVFQFGLWEFDKLVSWEAGTIDKTLRFIADKAGVKFRDLVRPFYVAITGSAQSLPLFDSMELLGRDVVRERLRRSLSVVGGVSAKEAKEWAKLLAAEAASEE